MDNLTQCVDLKRLKQSHRMCWFQKAEQSNLMCWFEKAEQSNLMCWFEKAEQSHLTCWFEKAEFCKSILPEKWQNLALKVHYLSDSPSFQLTCCKEKNQPPPQIPDISYPPLLHNNRAVLVYNLTMHFYTTEPTPWDTFCLPLIGFGKKIIKKNYKKSFLSQMHNQILGFLQLNDAQKGGGKMGADCIPNRSLLYDFYFLRKWW